MMLFVSIPEMSPLTLASPCCVELFVWSPERSPLTPVSAVMDLAPLSLPIEARRGARAELSQRFRQPFRGKLAHDLSRIWFDELYDHYVALRHLIEAHLELGLR